MAEWKYVGQAAKLSQWNTAPLGEFVYKVFYKADPLSPSGRVYKVVNPKTERSFQLRSVAPILKPAFKTALQVNPLTGTPILFHVVPKGTQPLPSASRGTSQVNVTAVTFPNF